jgi:hypothetical protein
MPFAIIAVVLLILGSAYGAISVLAKESEQNSENIISELNSIDSMIVSTEHMIEKGLGEIIFQISTDPNGGTLTERKDTFDKRAAQWMSKTFPRHDKGVLVTLLDYNADLSIESLKLASNDSLTEGFTPSYLKATGRYTATFVSDSGTSTRTTDISTDGSCALPLVVEQGSFFDNMIVGPGSVLSQMMSYQLTSLAQYRVLNGYGVLAEYGNMGTMSILTHADVNEAYQNSMKIIELMSFKNTSDENWNNLEKVDLADMLVSKDGYIELDISAIYSQALMSIMDDLVLKWLDYFYGNVLLNVYDTVSDSIGDALNSLVGFFTGKDKNTAAPYIEAILEENGYDVSKHRYLMSGKTFKKKKNIDGRTDHISIPGFSVDIPYPSVDLMDWEGVKKFKSTYRHETNEIREWLRNIVNTAAVEIGQSKAFGTIRIDINPEDEESLLQTVSVAIDAALDKGNDSVNRIMTSAISSQTIIDPFYAEVYLMISRDSDKIYGLSTFDDNVKKQLRTAIEKELEERIGTILDPNVIETIVNKAYESNDVGSAKSTYTSAVESCINDLTVLQNVPGGQSGLLKNIAKDLFKAGLIITDVFTDVHKRIRTLCEEVLRNEEMEAYDGLIHLPEGRDFILVDGNGNTSVEKLALIKTTSPIIDIKGPNNNLGDCVHYVGFNDSTGASYATTFSLTLKDTISYQATSAGTLETAMRTHDSAYNGSTGIDIDLKITVASAWGLAGVKDYQASNTILEDAWNLLIKLLSPILEPLRKIVSMISDALSILGSALMEIAKYVAAIVERLYNALMEPLEQLKNFIEQKLDSFFNTAVEKAVEAVQWIVGIDLSKQTVGFSFMGFTLTFTTQMSTWINNTKNLLTVKLTGSISNLTFSGSVTIKQRGSGSDKEMLLSGGAEISGQNWNVKADIDPLMKSTKHMIVFNGHVKGVAFDIMLPDLIQYQQIDFTLSDVPGLGAALSNIPIPIPGMKASVDAGINLKYNIPFETGILINEFELNPPGDDKGNEWVELLNATYSTVDLTGYTIHAGSDPKAKVFTITSLTLSPGQREVIVLPGSFLNNSGSNLLSGGEFVVLNNPSGETVDITPGKKDSKNDGYTWQRVADGAIDWTFAQGTPGGGNCGGLVSGEMVKTQMMKILKDSAMKTMGKMKKLTSVDDLSEFFKIAIHDAITVGIEMIAGCLVEAAIFVSLDITDASSTTCVGFMIALFIDSGFVEEGLKYLVGEIESILLNIENPYGLKLRSVFTDNIYLGITVYAGLTTPKFLGDVNLYPKVKLGVHINTNVSGLIRLIGGDDGTWKVTAGVIIMDCPSALLPSAMKADKTLSSDLWLVRAVFRPA